MALGTIVSGQDTDYWQSGTPCHIGRSRPRFRHKVVTFANSTMPFGWEPGLAAKPRGSAMAAGSGKLPIPLAVYWIGSIRMGLMVNFGFWPRNRAGLLWNTSTAS